jgi:hypothetical protein
MAFPAARPSSLAGVEAPEPAHRERVSEQVDRNQYAASPDGERFLILSLIDHNRSPIIAVLNWRGLLRQ